MVKPKAGATPKEVHNIKLYVARLYTYSHAIAYYSLAQACTESGGLCLKNPLSEKGPLFRLRSTIF